MKLALGAGADMQCNKQAMSWSDTALAISFHYCFFRHVLQVRMLHITCSYCWIGDTIMNEICLLMHVMRSLICDRTAQSR